ncbi:hypothetical protein MTO96_030047 [Rhipicephalus appendiculatus]
MRAGSLPFCNMGNKNVVNINTTKRPNEEPHHPSKKAREDITSPTFSVSDKDDTTETHRVSDEGPPGRAVPSHRHATREGHIQRAFPDEEPTSSTGAFGYDKRVTTALTSATPSANALGDQRVAKIVRAPTPTESAFGEHDRIATALILPASYADASFAGRASTSSAVTAAFKLGKLTTTLDAVEKTEEDYLRTMAVAMTSAECMPQEEPTDTKAEMPSSDLHEVCEATPTGSSEPPGRSSCFLYKLCGMFSSSSGTTQEAVGAQVAQEAHETSPTSWQILQEAFIELAEDRLDSLHISVELVTVIVKIVVDAFAKNAANDFSNLKKTLIRSSLESTLQIMRYAIYDGLESLNLYASLQKRRLLKKALAIMC